MSALDLFSLSGRTVVITGGGSGLGRAIALGCASAGASVVIGDIDGGRAESVASEAATAGARSIGRRVDVADEMSVAALFDEAESSLGGVDVAFCNAGISGYYRRIDEVDINEWRRVLDVNLTGVMLTAKHAARHMIPRGTGKIVLTASIWGLIGSDSVPIPDYAATKGGVVNLTRELALELANLGITVNAIAPGFFNTNIGRDKDTDPAIKQALRDASIQLIPTHRRAEAEEITGAAVFLASAASNMVNGHVLVVDAGCVAR